MIASTVEKGAAMPRKQKPKAETGTPDKRLYEAGSEGSRQTNTPPERGKLWEHGSEGHGPAGPFRRQGTLFERGWEG
jgi:hypothetical protein